MGGPDPWLNTVISIEFCLGQKIAYYKREDPLLYRVHPLQIYILHTFNNTTQGRTKLQQAVTHITWIVLLFLLRPGKYWKGETETLSTLFQLREIQ